MESLYAKNIQKDDKYYYKSYTGVNLNEVKSYYDKLIENKIKIAKIVKFSRKNDEIIEIQQENIKDLNLDEFIFFDAINNNSLSKESFKVFKKFIKMYFEKIYELKGIAVDCKLNNFMLKDFMLIDIVPTLFNTHYDKNVNSLKYVCYNKDLQIKNIIVYWLKYYIKYAYKDLDLYSLERDFNKLKYEVQKYYQFEYNEELNEIEQQYTKRFELLCNMMNFDSIEDVKERFLKNTFSKVSNLSLNIPKTMDKIYVLGGTGAGKTYVTSIINKVSDYSVINLDDIYWKDDFSTPNNIEDVKNTLKSEMEKSDKFIIEGSYLDEWIYDAFDKCDKIFVLKTKYKEQKKRVISRFIKRKLKIEECSHTESLKSIKELLAWSKTYSNNLETFLDKSKNKYGEKIIILEDSNELLKQILMK